MDDVYSWESTATAPLQNSPSVSPPDSAASTSTTSSIRKRKLGGDNHAPPSLSYTRDMTNGAYIAREENLKREEQEGRLKFFCTSNDGVDQHMIWLIDLKNIFARQLPNMPTGYIVRFLMDRNHKSMMIIRGNTVVGGITYRPCISQKFGEIVFLAIKEQEQVKGYGTRLMNHLKQHARDVDGLTHFLTYADNNAVGYFTKQGFTKEIQLEKERWDGYIKHYDGGILMECVIDPKLPYTDLSIMIRCQRSAIDEKIRELSDCHVIYPGINFQKNEYGVLEKSINVDEDIPGLMNSDWTIEEYGYSQFKPTNLVSDHVSYKKTLTVFMLSILKALEDHPDAWPFKEPVDGQYVPDYYKIIKNPMDLKTMSKRVESEKYYVTFEMFVADAKKMFSNARIYNAADTIYYKCSTRLERYFLNRIQAQTGLESCINAQP